MSMPTDRSQTRQRMRFLLPGAFCLVRDAGAALAASGPAPAPGGPAEQGMSSAAALPPWALGAVAVAAAMAVCGAIAYFWARWLADRRTARLRRELREARESEGELRHAYDALEVDVNRHVAELETVNQALASTADERSRAVDRLQKLNQLKEALLASGSLEEKLKTITDSLAEIFDVDFCRIWLTRPGDLCEEGCVHAHYEDGPHACVKRERCLHLMASSGRHARLDSKMHHRVPFGCYKIGRVGGGQEKKFLTNDLAHDRRVPNPQYAAEHGLVAFAGYRLASPTGEPMGVLAFLAKTPISAEEDAMLESMASSISEAIQVAQVQEERERLIEELQDALANVKTLRGLLPICASCKKIRDDSGYWNQIEVYLKDHSDADFSHGLCPECLKALYPDYYKGDEGAAAPEDTRPAD
ncbi:MAG: GAF domain-containing protein [Candidatus Hydrogenedentes bacterium]|nr:GAF domain-containing protein [Candidatus Hydrogenedentota bacterium]